MYADYLAKVAEKRQALGVAGDDVNMDTDNPIEEAKQLEALDFEMVDDFNGKSKTMKTGEKYIIRKLISFKTTIPKVDEYISKLEQIRISGSDQAAPTLHTNTFNLSNMAAHPVTTETNTMQNYYTGSIDNSAMAGNHYRTMHGYNDDSQLVYNPQPSLFQPQAMPMPRMNAMMGYNNQLLAGMQNLNIAGANSYYSRDLPVTRTQNNYTQDMYWDNGPQMPTSSHNHTGHVPMANSIDSLPLGQAYPQTHVDPYSPMLTKSNMQEFVFGQSSASAFSPSLGNVSTNCNSNPGLHRSDDFWVNSSYASPAPMRLPAHVTKLHGRSNSMTPVDHGHSHTLLFDQFQANPPKPVLGKFSSEAVDRGQGKMFGSSSSLPAIKNMSDYYESAASDSSCFDKNDSELASSIDIQLDANGQPIFDNVSYSNDNSQNIDSENSFEPQVSKPKSQKRNALKKKSAFHKNEIRKNSDGSDYSISDDDG